MVVQSVVLSLAWFACVNAISSIVAAVLARGVSRLDATTRQPRLFLGLRLLPSAVSVFFAAAMFLPSQWMLEPRDTTETLGFVWYLLAGTGAWLLYGSASRAVAVVRVSSLARQSERPSTLENPHLHEVDSISGVSLAGVLRPRILIGRRITGELSSAELDVAVAHEFAHRDAFDNLARWSMLCAPDFLRGSIVALQLEHAWHVAAESRADARAIQGDRRRAVHLASALLKVARLSADGTQQMSIPAWSTLNDSDLLEWRVHRLLNGSLDEADLERGRLSRAALVVMALLIAIPILAEPLHRLTETLVASLP
jgi:beta-lactamase regulating signal transducer with metallopeptidase domain